MKLRFVVLLAVLLFSLLPRALAQTGALRGEVTDPSGAVVPGASVTLTLGSKALETKSGADGRYAFRSLAAGVYTVGAAAPGFAPLSIPGIAITSGETKELNLPLAIAVEKQEVTVEGQNQGVSLNPDENASQTVIKGSDLDALSDDPDELQSELQALAGPAAGPNGGQIYIDGFEGGQIPPKSSILEIRVNQNPFSAEYDRIGYGRIEIITKPGSAKLKGSISSYGNSSGLNTANPFLPGKPSYYIYGLFGDLSGPLSKTAAYFFHASRFDRQNQSIVNGLNPADPSTNIIEAFPTPLVYWAVNPRFDFQVGKNHTISVRDAYYRTQQSGSGVGTLNLPEQASSSTSITNELQFADTFIVNPHLLSEARVMWRRIRSDQAPSHFTPTVTVQGAFTTGGSSAGTVQDHQDDFVLQDYATATAGTHTLRFGARLRTYRDANYSTSGRNGSYFFAKIADYEATTPMPAQYSATVIANPLARAILFDASVFCEDDWRVKPNFDLGLGLRYEGQNRIHDRADWAPRLSMAWSPKRTGNGAAKTVIRAGYGWFYNRFTVPTSFSSAAGAPYVIETIHDNLINQQSYVIDNPNFFDPSAAEPPAALASAGGTVPSYHTIDPHFHAALDMQGGVGVDRQIAKKVTANVTYLYTQGVHQYLSDNVTAPAFNIASYTVTGNAPAAYNYQFQSGGFYRQNQLIFSASLRLKHLVLNGNYVLNEAKSDTQGVTSMPSVAQDPGFDYGRASFGVRHRVTLLESYTGPHGIVIASLLAAQSGTPYNLTIGEDLTGNNQFNARPAYGVCGDTGVIETQYGCLDTDPAGKGERIVPYGIGTGPANAVYHLRISKVIGIGPRLKTEGEGNTFQGGNSVSGRGLSGGGAAIRLDAAAPRRYNLTLVAGADNLFNIVNLGTPNGVLLSPLFNRTQSLAGGEFSAPTPGNRTIMFQSSFSF